MVNPSNERRPPSISHRISLRFLPRPATEPTSTLVLNGGGITDIFTDFRPYLDDPALCETAFAGVKTYMSDGRCHWSRLVADKDRPDAEVPDIGRCEMMENGDEKETGEMLNPETGCVESYEEVWRDEAVPPLSRVSVVQLNLAHHDFGDSEVRGIFVMVGKWCQAVLRTHERVSARRWMFDEGWTLIATYGESEWPIPVPKGETLSTTSLEIPPPFIHNNSTLTWEVREDYVWESV